MRIQRIITLANATMLIAATLLVAGIAVAKSKAAPPARKIDPANFRDRVDNPYFPLVPGTRFVYRETSGAETRENLVTVLAETKLILGVTCTVVHDVVRSGERIIEDTMDWYAQDLAGNVWYFGEATKEYFPHGRVSDEGSWEAGVGGAEAGLVMAANPAAGDPYRQEFRKGIAEDMAQVVAVGDVVTVPQGKLTGCVKTKDWSMLEAGHEFKWYAKGIGFVRSQSTSKELVELLSVTRP